MLGVADVDVRMGQEADRPPRDWLFLTIYLGALLAFYPGGVIGLVMGFARIRRDPDIATARG